MIPSLKQLFQRVWDWSSGEAEMKRPQGRNSQSQGVMQGEGNKYHQKDKTLSIPEQKSIFDRTATNVEGGIKYLQLMDDIQSSNSAADLNELKEQINNEEFGSKNQEILRKVYQEQLRRFGSQDE